MWGKPPLPSWERGGEGFKDCMRCNPPEPGRGGVSMMQQEAVLENGTLRVPPHPNPSPHEGEKGFFWNSTRLITFILAGEKLADFVAIGRFFFERFRVPLMAMRIEEIAAIDMNAAGKAKERVGH